MTHTDCRPIGTQGLLGVGKLRVPVTKGPIQTSSQIRPRKRPIQTSSQTRPRKRPIQTSSQTRPRNIIVTVQPKQERYAYRYA